MNQAKIIVRDTISGTPNWMLTGNELLLDLPDNFDVTLSKSIAELSDVDKIKSEQTLGFQLPYTPKNRFIIDRFVNVNVAANTARIAVDVFVQSSRLIFEELFVIGSDDEGQVYEVELELGTQHWLEGANNCLLKDIDFGGFVLTKNNLIDNWDNFSTYTDGDLGVWFPLVHYGKFLRGDKVSVEDFRPWFHLLSVLQKGFCKIGWQFRCPILETNKGRRLITYILKEDYGTDPRLLNSRAFKAQRTTSLFGLPLQVIPLVFDNEIFDNGNNYNNLTGVFSAVGLFDFIVNAEVFINGPDALEALVGITESIISVQLVHEDTSGVISVLTNDFRSVAVNQPPILTSIEISAEDVSLLPGDKVYAQAVFGVGGTKEIRSGEFYNIPKRTVLLAGDTIILSETIHPEYTLLDYFKGIVHLFNGKIITDWVNQTVWLYTPEAFDWLDEQGEGFYLDQAVNISNTIICQSKRVSNEQDKLKRYVRLQFKKSTDAYIKENDLEAEFPLFAKEIDRGSNFTEGTEKKTNPFFEPTINVKSNTLASNAGNPIDMPYVWDNKDNKLSFDIKPRILYAAGHVVQRVLLDPITLSHVPASFFWGDDDALNNKIPYAFQESTNALAVPSLQLYPEKIVYGDDSTVDLFSLAWKTSIAASIRSQNISFQRLMTMADYQGENFRKWQHIFYKGQTLFARLQTIDSFTPLSSGTADIELTPDSSLADDCTTTIQIQQCDNNPKIVIIPDTITGNVSAIADDSEINSTITADVWEYSDDGGNTWQSYSPGNVLVGLSSVIFRRTLTFQDGCPSKIVTNTYNQATVCSNTAQLVLNYDNGTNTIQATANDNFNSPIASDDWTVKVDGGATISYIPNDPISGFMDIELTRTITFSNGCPPINLTQSFTVEPPQCNNQPQIQLIELAECLYDIELTGTTSSDIHQVVIQIQKNGKWFNWNHQPIAGNFDTIKALIYYCDSCPPSCLELECPNS